MEIPEKVLNIFYKEKEQETKNNKNNKKTVYDLYKSMIWNSYSGPIPLKRMEVGHLVNVEKRIKREGGSWCGYSSEAWITAIHGELERRRMIQNNLINYLKLLFPDASIFKSK